MKKQAVLGLILTLLISFNIYASEQVTAEEGLPQQVYIPVLPRGVKIPFWQAVKEGVVKASNDYNVKVTYEGPKSETDAITQLNILQTALAKDPQAIVLAAIDSKAAAPYLEEAQKRGIPIIGFDTGVDSPIVKTTVATDNYEAGVLAAEKMGQLIGRKGKVGIVVHDQTSQSGIGRRDGFIDVIKQKYPDIELIPIRYSGTEIIKAEQDAREMLENHPDLKGIFGTSDYITRGIIRAIKELNKAGQVAIIGFDSGKVLIDAIREGIVYGAVTQDPQAIGYKAVEAAIKAYQGERLPEFIDTGFKWYDKSNIDSPEIKNLLYE